MTAAPPRADGTALAAAWRRARRHTPRALVFLTVTCTTIAFVIYGFDERRFPLKLL